MLEQWKNYVATHKNTDREHLLTVSEVSSALASLAQRFLSYNILILAACQLHIAQISHEHNSHCCAKPYTYYTVYTRPSVHISSIGTSELVVNTSTGRPFSLAKISVQCVVGSRVRFMRECIGKCRVD